MTLMEAFSKHLVTGQQGQLVIKFAGDVHLCKILVEDGAAVHISHGRLSPQQILDSLAAKAVEWINFIAGYPVRKRLEFPLHQNLLAVIGQKSAAPQPAATIAQAAVPQPAVKPQPAPAAAPAGPMLPAEKVVAVVEGFIELIGPLGTILADQAASALSYSNGTPMPEASFNGFVLALAKEVPDADRAGFIEQFKL